MIEEIISVSERIVFTPRMAVRCTFCQYVFYRKQFATNMTFLVIDTVGWLVGWSLTALSTQ